MRFRLVPLHVGRCLLRRFFSLSLPPVLDLSRGFVTLFYIFRTLALVSALLLIPAVLVVSYPAAASKLIAANRQQGIKSGV